MEKKTILITGICAIIILLILIFYFKTTSHPSNPIKLTEDKLITNQTLIDLIVNKKKSPLGNDLEMTVVAADDPQIADEPWEYHYYVCNKNEHLGWVYIYGGNTGPAGLYGPFDWCLI
jgi:hypothetical protein